MDFVELIGYAAAFLATLAFLPQVLKSWKTKSTGDLSWGMLSLIASALFLWLVYGIMISSMPLILEDAISLVLVLALVFIKIRHG